VSGEGVGVTVGRGATVADFFPKRAFFEFKAPGIDCEAVGVGVGDAVTGTCVLSGAGAPGVWSKLMVFLIVDLVIWAFGVNAPWKMHGLCH